MQLQGTRITEDGYMEPFDGSAADIKYPDIIMVKHHNKEYVFYKQLNGQIGVR
jgi:hypothetical protein